MMSLNKALLCAVVASLAVVAITGCPKAPDSSTAGVPTAPGMGMEGSSGPTGANSTSIQVKGSDTLLQVAQALAEAYKTAEPSVEVAVAGGGSGTGFQALIEGTTDIAAASREIKDKEAEQAKAKGIEPVENIIGYDGIAVIVNKGNPVARLTIEQLSDIYTGAITDWKAVGGFGEIFLLSRETTSGTFEYFKEHIVRQGEKGSQLDFADAIIMLLSNSAIREQVADTETAIGYVGLGYLDDSVKAVAIFDAGGAAVSPSVDTVKDGTYPVSRPLLMYTSQKPTPQTAAYLEWILGDDGQKIVADEGFVPVN